MSPVRIWSPAPAILSLALLTTQEPKTLELGRPIDGIIGVDSAVVQTPTLDANYCLPLLDFVCLGIEEIR